MSILLLHAAGGAARNFGTVARRLAEEGLDARALDLPGHGREAGKPPLRTLEAMARHALEAAPAGPLLIGGHSMGGAVALTAAVLEPARVSGVVMIATGARLQMSRAVAAKAREDWEGFLAALGAAGSPLMTLDQLRDTGPETVAADLEACVGWDGLALAPRVQASVLLLAGEKDRVAPVKLVEELGRAIPGARVVVIPEAGHVLPVERPAEVASEIAAWAKRLS